MTKNFMSMKNLEFTLESKIDGMKESHAQPFRNHPPKTRKMVLTAALDFAKKELHPIFSEMDKEPPRFEKGAVKVHPKVPSILQTLGEDGWISAVFPEKWGGENMPGTLLHCIHFIFAAANYSGSVYCELTIGAAKLILSFGSQALKNTYLPPLLAGKWQGTMALTEPEAGTSLGDLTTSARSQPDGRYKITGEKIFISAGDHDGVGNVVHLMLARIEGAPPGIKGISLFVVPKFRPNRQGDLVENDVVITQIFHKLGYRGAPITGIRLGDKDNCYGYLVGEENKGLAYMFQMMNGARLEVGLGATAIATAAYHAALDYCRTRKQGRRITDRKNAVPVPIICHPDVKRMLLFQRAVSEGSLALILQCGIWEDQCQQNPDQKDLHLLIELLTPVAKTYPSEMGVLSVSQSIQCFGGYGYCDDYPVEQHFRDMRIHPIHEGTTGIQAVDLLERKLVMENGKALGLLKQEIEDAVAEAGKTTGSDDGKTHPGQMAKELSEALADVEKATVALGGVAMEKGLDAYLADATLFLEMFGILTIAWQWLTMATTASTKLSGKAPKKEERLFLEGKVTVAAYFYTYELPKIKGIAASLKKSHQMTASMSEDGFSD